MKDKDKELLLKDLSARLPYGVNVKIITHKAYEVDRVAPLRSNLTPGILRKCQLKVGGIN